MCKNARTKSLTGRSQSIIYSSKLKIKESSKLTCKSCDYSWTIVRGSQIWISKSSDKNGII